MARTGTRKDESDLKLRPEPPAARKRVSRLAVTGWGVAARICTALAFVCCFLPWLSAPGMNIVAQYSWMFGLYIVPGDFLFPMYGTGEMAALLDTVAGSGMYGSVWSVFLIGWAVGLVLLAVRFVQSMMGLRDSKRLVLGGLVTGIIGVAWAVAVLILNVQYVNLLQDTFGVSFTMFEVPPGPILAAVFAFVAAACAKHDKQAFVTR